MSNDSSSSNGIGNNGISKNQSLWSPAVAALEPYVPGEQPADTDLVKLNTNENPYPPSAQALAAISAAADGQLRLYPDPESGKLKQVIAEYFNLDSDNVFLGNGSDEVLAHAFNAFFRQQSPILFPDLTYSFYPVYCQLYGIDFEKIPLNEKFEINVDDYSRINGGIIFPNPNAPTAVGLARASIIRLLEKNPSSVVIVDEAYVDFTDGGTDDDDIGSVIDLIPRFENLLVVHTLSKSRSFAGMRVGYALGSAHLIDALQRVKNSFNSYPIDRLAEVAAIASFADDDYFKATNQRVINNRQQLVESLTAMGFQALPSQANFVLARHQQQSAKGLFEQLRQHKVIVRYFDTPRIADYLRISVGDEEQNQRLLEALSAILNA